MSKAITLGAATILGLYANPTFFKQVPCMAKLEPGYRSARERLRRELNPENRPGGCSACQKRKITAQVYAELVAAFVSQFVETYWHDRDQLKPLLDYLQVDSIELPVKEGPRVVLTR